MAREKAPASIRRYVAFAIAPVVAAFIAIQCWSAWQATKQSAAVLDGLAKLPSSNLQDEKTRQEVASLRLKNEQQIAFVSNLLAGLSVTVGIFAGMSGAWLAFHQYLRARTRERLDRAAIDFGKLWEGLSSQQAETRAGSVAALSDYFSEDKEDFHARGASALALVGRMQNPPIASLTLTPVIEMALRKCPEAMGSVSWQGLKLFRANFSGLSLKGFDFRDSDLREADFRGADLQDARFNAATLVGARFNGANLTGANLEYADLARASLRNANLTKADLRNIQLLDLDVEGADFTGARFAPHATDWRLIKNWRSSTMDGGLRARLLELHGPPVRGPRVLMLTWEYPPFVSGGGWTAVYHFLSNLRKHGADIVVMVPLPMSILDKSIFGNEIEVAGVGREPETKTLADVSGYSAYSAYSAHSAYSGYSAYQPATSQLYYAHATRPLMTIVEEFRLNALRKVDELGLNCDVIHAHDWLTFGAAASIGRSLGKPWIAHYHSLEHDRQPSLPSQHIIRIEADACRAAARLVAVSNATAARLRKFYNAPDDHIDVVPNCLSEDDLPVTNLGAFDAARVVFLGRLAEQKGIDRFVEIAKEVSKVNRNARFLVYGTGDKKSELDAMSLERHVEIPEDREVPALSVKELSVGVRTIQFDTIAFASVDESGAARVRTTVKWDKKKAVELEILRHGFTAKVVESSSFTHLIHVANAPEGMHPDYLVSASGLPRIKEWWTSLISSQGGLPWHRRFEAFDRASVVVVPSRWEPFGLVVLEAMRHGVPVVYTKDAGVAEVLQSGIPFGELEIAVAETVKLLADKSYWERIAEAQRAEMAQYGAREYELLLEDIWARVAGRQTAGKAQVRGAGSV